MKDNWFLEVSPDRRSARFVVCGKEFRAVSLGGCYPEVNSLADFCRCNCEVDADKCVVLARYYDKYRRIACGYEDKRHEAMPHELMFRLGHWRCPKGSLSAKRRRTEKREA